MSFADESLPTVHLLLWKCAHLGPDSCAFYGLLTDEFEQADFVIFRYDAFKTVQLAEGSGNHRGAIDMVIVGSSWFEAARVCIGDRGGPDLGTWRQFFRYRVFSRRAPSQQEDICNANHPLQPSCQEQDLARHSLQELLHSRPRLYRRDVRRLHLRKLPACDPELG